MKVIWSPTARRRTQAAVDFFAAERPLASEKWLDTLVQRVELLRDFPEQGRAVPEWHESSVREVLHEPYRVIYQVLEDRVEILTLSHVRQKLSLDPPAS